MPFPPRLWLYKICERLMRRTLNRLRDEISSKNAELDKSHTELDKLHAELDGLHGELDKRNSELNETNSELNKRNSELDEANSELSEFYAELNKLQTEYKELVYEFELHKTDKTNDHWYTRYGYDCMISNLQLALVELSCPGNRERLVALKDTHFGESCFIIGNGPSLKASDLDLLKDIGVFCFASNRIYLIFDQTEWRPDVWATDDEDYISSLSNELSDLSLNTKMLSCDSVIKLNTLIPGAVYYPFIKLERLPFEFNTDITRGVYWFTTVTGSLINIAAYMGFKKMYLLGVDNTNFNYIEEDVNGVKHLTRSSSSHFASDYLGDVELKSNSIMDFSYENRNRVYQDIKWHCEFHEIQVCNATRGGELEVFERITLEDAIHEFTR